MNENPLSIAMLCIHSSPIGTLGTKDTGGMSIYVRELARELGRRDHSVDIFTHLNAMEDPEVMELYSNVRLIHLVNGGPPPPDKRAFIPVLPHYFQDLSLFKVRHGRCYDLVHSHYWLSGPLGMWAQERWSIPNIITFHTLGEVKKNLGLQSPEAIERIRTEQTLVDSCTRIIAGTEQEKNQLVRYYDTGPNKVGIVPCGVDFERFVPLRKSAARKKLQLSSEDNVILYVGRFDRLKGLDLLLEAIPLVCHSDNLAVVVLGGEGPNDPETGRLEQLCRKWGIQHLVQFFGPVAHEDLPLYYSAADALIIPSRYESFSLVALEALACGTPVLATLVGAMDHLIQEGVNGNIIPNAEPRSLASVIDRFIGQKTSSHFSPKHIRESVMQFTWDNAASLLLQEYALVCER